MSYEDAWAVIFNAVSVGILAFAVIRGGRPEKLGALINISGFAATVMVRLAIPFAWAPAEIIVLLIDLVVAAAFYWLAVTTIRFWPIWAAGFAMADLFTSVGTALLPHIRLFVYHTGLGIYAYLALGTLALGTFRLPRDADPVLRNGSRQSWIQHLEEI